MSEDMTKIYNDIKNIVAGKNGNDVCNVLVEVLADILILYCDAYDYSEIDRMVDSIGLNIKEVVKRNLMLKEKADD